MTELPAVAFIAASSLGLVGIIAGLMYLTFRDIDRYRARLLVLSRLLQRIEYATGQPYFTTSGNYLDIEQPEWLLEILRTDSLRRALKRFVESEEAEEEEDYEADEEDVEDTEEAEEEESEEEEEGEGVVAEEGEAEEEEGEGVVPKGVAEKGEADEGDVLSSYEKLQARIKQHAQEAPSLEALAQETQ